VARISNQDEGEHNPSDKLRTEHGAQRDAHDTPERIGKKGLRKDQSRRNKFKREDVHVGPYEVRGKKRRKRRHDAILEQVEGPGCFRKEEE